MSDMAKGAAVVVAMQIALRRQRVEISTQFLDVFGRKQILEDCKSFAIEVGAGRVRIQNRWRRRRHGARVAAASIDSAIDGDPDRSPYAGMVIRFEVKRRLPPLSGNPQGVQGR